MDICEKDGSLRGSEGFECADFIKVGSLEGDSLPICSICFDCLYFSNCQACDGFVRCVDSDTCRSCSVPEYCILYFPCDHFVDRGVSDATM